MGLALMQEAPTEDIRLELPLKEGEVSIAGVVDSIQNVADFYRVWHNKSVIFYVIMYNVSLNDVVKLRKNKRSTMDSVTDMSDTK